MSIASELLPEPLGPQQTVIWSRGISTSMPLRLCCRAPRTLMAVADRDAAAACGAAVASLPTRLPCPLRAQRRRCGTQRRPGVRIGFAADLLRACRTATIRPPPAPPSGPRSMIQSAVLMTSRLCSTTSTVLPASTKSCSTFSSIWMSAKCRPVVGSSSRYSVRPVLFLTSSRASLIRCASPPESVGDGWPSFR